MSISLSSASAVAIPFALAMRAGNIYDEGIFDSVVNRDEYGIAGRDLTGKSVLDIGAHIGCFSYLAESRDAGPLHAYEPNPANFDLLKKNLRAGKAFPEAVGFGGGHGRFESNVPPPCGLAGTVVTGSDGDIPVVGLDEAILRLAFGTSSRCVDLLKIDAEGAEWGMLSGARCLDLVREIVGEWHEYHWGHDWKAADLHRLLPGFTVEIKPPHAGTTWGLFRATRSP